MTLIPRRKKRARPDFSLSVINIVFLLLLFYLASGSLVKPGETATDAPVTAGLRPELLPRPLLVVAADRSLLLDGVSIALDDLPAAARGKVEEGGVLNVLADRSMSGRDFLDVLARIDTGGVPMRIVSMHRPATGDPAAR